MNTRQGHSPLGAVFVAVASLAALVAAEALGPRIAGAVPSPSASTSVAQPGRQTLDGASIPEDPGPAPRPEEWNNAVEVVPNVRSTPAPDCTIRRIRAWLRIKCQHSPGVGLVAGDPKDVGVVTEAPASEWDKNRREIFSSVSVAQIPLQRGKSRIVSFLGFKNDGGYGPAVHGEGPTFQIGWRTGAPDPIIVATMPSLAD